MGMDRLPKTAKERRHWLADVATGHHAPPYELFREDRQSFGKAYRRLYFAAFNAGAQAALDKLLGDLARSDDPLEGLPPHLVKSAQAAARARARRRKEKVA